MIFARASRDASASAAIAFCKATGKRTSLTSTRSTLTPHGSVASSRPVYSNSKKILIKIKK
jgi:hypothetical protein